MSFDVEAIRRDFPILATRKENKDLIYLDNAASTQKPQCVIDAVGDFYAHSNANIHRGVHYLAEKATDLYESGRKTVAEFINAPSVDEVVFVRGTTEGMNLLASTIGQARIGEGDEILISTMEHHANIVPWQLLCERTGAVLKVVPISAEGVLDLEAYQSLLSEKTKLVSIVHVSNSLGTVNPVKELARLAHEVGAWVIFDGAQAVGHFPVDVQDLGCDFYVFSGHKLFGPTGIGVVYGKYELLSQLPPYQGGGDMISKVSFEGTTYKDPPGRFEAGTPNIAGVIGMAAGIRYLQGLDREAMHQYEVELLAYATEQLQAVDGVTIYGKAPEKASVISFTLEGVHPHDMGTVLDASGVAIRAGHHCTQPLMAFLGVPATARASMAFYNTREEIDVFVAALNKVQMLFC